MKEVVQHVQVYPTDINTPISLYLKFIGNREGILLESAEVDGRLGRYSLLAWDFKFKLLCEHGRMRIPCCSPGFEFLKTLEGEDFISAIKSVIANIYPLPNEKGLPPITRSIIGFMGYECAVLFEEVLSNSLSSQGMDALFVFPGKQLLYDHLHHRCFYISTSGSLLGEDVPDPLRDEAIEVGEITSSLSKEAFVEAVSRIKEMIHGGEAIQVVLSTQFSAPFSGNPFTIYRRLRQTNPSPYMFFVNLEEICLIGSSPELMVRSRDSVVEVRPIAGTRPRGSTEEEDISLEKDLLADPKERAEHVMLVDLGRNDVGRIAAPGSVEVERFMQVERFSHVMHLTSYVQARLRSGLDGLDIIGATFPAGTVSGAPKIRAMQIIAGEEPCGRGPYAGAIGWIGLGEDRADVDMGIIIRSAWIKGNRIFWQAGAGIVADSHPLKEWQECHNKARVIDKILKEDGGSDAFTHR